MSLAVFVLACIAWAATVHALYPGGVPASYQAQSNLIAIEKRVHDPACPRVVLVGSSLSATFTADDLPRDVYNLSLSGHGAQTGLAVLLHGVVPPTVWIEAGETALLPTDDTLIDEVFSPVGFALESWFPIARHDHQPIAVLDESLRRLTARGKVTADYVGSPERLEARVRALTEELQQPLDLHVVHDRIDRLAALVAEVERRGARVMFFEVPVDDRLRLTAHTAGVHRLLEASFPSDRYPWVTVPSWSEYQTSDGLHLVPESATRYARVLAAH